MTSPRELLGAETHELFNDIVDLLNEVIKIFDRKLGRSGGGICLYDAENDIEYLQSVGKPEENYQRFLTNALNKCLGLAAHGEAVSSFQIADENADPPIYGGGIKLTKRWFLAFSGYPPGWDQALCIAVAEYFGILHHTNSILIMQYANNDNVVEARAIVAEVAQAA